MLREWVVEGGGLDCTSGKLNYLFKYIISGSYFMCHNFKKLFAAMMIPQTFMLIAFSIQFSRQGKPILY